MFTVRRSRVGTLQHQDEEQQAVGQDLQGKDNREQIDSSQLFLCTRVLASRIDLQQLAWSSYWLVDTPGGCRTVYSGLLHIRSRESSHPIWPCRKAGSHPLVIVNPTMWRDDDSHCRGDIAFCRNSLSSKTTSDRQRSRTTGQSDST